MSHIKPDVNVDACGEPPALHHRIRRTAPAAIALALLGAACGVVTAPDEAPIVGAIGAPRGADGISRGSFYTIIGKHSGKCVDDTGWGITNGTALQQYGCGSNQDNQQWQLRSTDNGYYNILSRHAASLGWDVTGGPGATGAGAKVQLWGISGSGGANQQWKPVPLGGGDYKLVARHSGKCLDVPSASIDDSVVLQQWDCNGTDAQRFRLQKVDPAKDHAALTQGITSIDMGGAVPSALVVYGDNAFPIAVDASRHAFIAAARVGAGKVLHYGHDAFLAGELTADPGAAKLLLNALAWMAPGKKPTVGVEPGLDKLVAILTQRGFTVKTTTPADLSGIDVYCMTSSDDRPDTEVQKIVAFMESGGGLVSSGLAWAWGGSHTHPAENYPGNKYLRAAGIGVTTTFSNGGVKPISAVALPELLHARRALSRFVDHVSGGAQLPLVDQDTAADTIDFAIDFLPLSFAEYFSEVNVLQDKVGPVVPSGAKPLNAKAHPIERIVVHIDHKYADESPPDAVKEHPAAADFPGAVPAGAMAISKTLTVDGDYAGREARFSASNPRAAVWRSTGVYAPAGKKIHVKIDAAAAGKGLDVLLGAHTDTLWDHDIWPRFPELPRSYPLEVPEIDAASAFGGLVYVRVPVGSHLGPITVTIEGGVGAPLFQKGKTTVAAWKSVERSQPGPWAEIATDKLSITVPSAAIAGLDDPTAVLDLWDKVLDADADLAVIPHARPRAERILTDREISGGYLHSGYPIMAHLDVQSALVSVDSLKAGFWGPLHELGHNHQWSPWVIPGSGEANVNLFSVYASETALNIPRGKAISDLDPAKRAKRIQSYLAGGANFAKDWSVFTALETYLQLQEAFGWAPFQQVFTQYYADAPATDPKDGQGEIDRWVLRFSLAVNKDLGPFFKAWGFPVSPSVLAQIGALPAWPNNPMP